MSALSLFRARLEPGWMDYNGHLRDAYYGVVFSLAIDDVMDQLGLDAGYRGRTHCTLYTVESHMRFLREVKGLEPVDVATRILGSDRKRIHAGCSMTRGTDTAPVATGELMLLHVQQGDQPGSTAFPHAVFERLEALKASDAARAAWGPGSRRIELVRRSAPA